MRTRKQLPPLVWAIHNIWITFPYRCNGTYLVSECECPRLILTIKNTNHTFSEWFLHHWLHGVPQSSPLEPNFFLVYTYLSCYISFQGSFIIWANKFHQQIWDLNKIATHFTKFIQTVHVTPHSCSGLQRTHMNDSMCHFLPWKAKGGPTDYI